MQPAAILDWAGVVELVQAVQQQDSLRDSEIGALVKQRLKINSVAVLLNTLTILDAIAINCSEAVRCELADKKWMKRLGQACTERGMTPAAPAVLQLLANWTHTFEGEELALSAQAAAVAKLGRIPQPSSLAYQLRELVEQQTPLVGFQRGSDFMATFLNSPQLNSPQLSRSSAGTSSPLQSGRAAASGQANTAPAAPPSLMQKQAGFSGPNSHWVVARLSDMRMQAASLDEVEGVCRAAAEALERHQPPACADLDAAVAHGWNLAKACNMHCLEVKRMVSSDLADDVLGQALAVNDRFNAVLQAWEATSARIAVIQTSPTRQPTVADPPAGQAGRSTSGDQSSQLSGGATPQTGSRPAPDAAPLIDLSPPEPTRPAEASAASADQADAIMNLEDDFSLWGDGETVPGGAQQGKAQQGGAQQQQQEARASSAGSASSLERPSMEAQALDATAPAQRQPSTAQRLGSCNSGTPSTSFSHDRQPLPFEDFASFAHAQRSGSLAESDSAEFATISFADFSRTRKAGDAGSQAAESGVAASPWTIAQRGSDHQPASSPWTVAQRGTPGSAAPAQQSAPMAQQSAPDQEPACSPWTVAQRGTPGFASSAQQVGGPAWPVAQPVGSGSEPSSSAGQAGGAQHSGPPASSAQLQDAQQGGDQPRTSSAWPAAFNMAPRSVPLSAGDWQHSPPPGPSPEGDTSTTKTPAAAQAASSAQHAQWEGESQRSASNAAAEARSFPGNASTESGGWVGFATWGGDTVTPQPRSSQLDAANQPPAAALDLGTPELNNFGGLSAQAKRENHQQQRQEQQQPVGQVQDLRGGGRSSSLPRSSPWQPGSNPSTPAEAGGQVEVLQAKVKALQAQVEEAAQRHAQQMDAVRAKHAQEAAAHAETMAQLKGQAVTKLRNLMQQVEQLKGQQQQLEQQKAQRERELELRLEEAMQAEDSLVSELRAVRLQLGAKDDQIHALQQQQQQQQVQLQQRSTSVPPPAPKAHAGPFTRPNGRAAPQQPLPSRAASAGAGSVPAGWQLFGDFDPFGNGSRRGASHDGFSPFAASSVGASPFADGWASTSGRATPAAAAAVPRPQLAASSEEMARRYARFDALLTKSAHSAPISDAALRAYYRQPALRLRFTPAQFLQMTGRMTAGK